MIMLKRNRGSVLSFDLSVVVLDHNSALKTENVKDAILMLRNKLRKFWTMRSFLK